MHLLQQLVVLRAFTFLLIQAAMEAFIDAALRCQAWVIHYIVDELKSVQDNVILPRMHVFHLDNTIFRSPMQLIDQFNRFQFVH